MLPPFGGHLKLLKQGVHHAEIETTQPGGIPTDKQCFDLFDYRSTHR